MPDLRLSPGRAGAAPDLLHTEAVEINAARHCNIRCKSCSHGSPDLPAGFCSPAQVASDLAVLARWMRVDHVRILGGEPLLHPSLGALLEAVQASDIGTRVRILTNGLLLAEAPDDIWDLTDEIHISVYPNTVSAIERQVTALTTRAQTHATVLVAKYFGYFRVAYRRGGPDDSLTQAIYDTCQIGNVWRCLTVDAGRLYRCPQAVFAHIFAPAPPLIDAGGVDYLEIGSIESVRTLRDWLQRKAPLPSCRTCAGSVGHRHLHQQARPHAEEAMADGIDLAYLAALHDDLNADNACVTRTEVLWAGAQ